MLIPVFVCLHHFLSPLFWFYLSFYLFFHHFFPTASSSITAWFSSCLTPLFLPAVLSGHFQTFGVRQELPGVAYFSPPFPPIRSNTGIQSSVSSQRQLQEDQLTADQLVDLQTRRHVYLVSKLSVCWPPDFSFSVWWCWIFVLGVSTEHVWDTEPAQTVYLFIFSCVDRNRGFLFPWLCCESRVLRVFSCFPGQHFENYILFFVFVPFKCFCSLTCFLSVSVSFIDYL